MRYENVRGVTACLIRPFSVPIIRTHGTKQMQVVPPPAREGGVIVESVDELVDKLKNEAGVLG